MRSVSAAPEPELKINACEGGARFSVHVKPRASRSKILGVKEGALEIAVAAPPVDGAANAEVCELLASALGTAKRNVTIAKGDSSRTKLIEVHEVPVSEIATRLIGGAR